ncbi:hypothetical protein G6L32_07920 [Agrobacterium tumefaciens]|uniref:hypothetical protein n=1 Tax=Agrobacterium tumefaciens TaxID=358 RepID=UPI001571716E|nr:hypothetical protein [Agrobacterium tumefaciens]
MPNSETVRINGKLYRKFIPYPEEINDGTFRCIRCGQIDEEEFHDHDICVAAFDASPLPRPTLLPCPFCGSPDIDPCGWAGNDGSHGPACNDCCGSAQTVEVWNSRPITPVPQDVQEKAYEEADAFSDWLGCDSEKRERLQKAFEQAILTERGGAASGLEACQLAIDEYNSALERREHGGLAASNCVRAVEKVFYPERFQPVGALRQANEEK